MDFNVCVTPPGMRFSFTGDPSFKKFIIFLNFYITFLKTSILIRNTELSSLLVLQTRFNKEMKND